MWAKFESFLHFEVPKRIDIKNKKLGLLFRTLQGAFVIAAITQMLYNKPWLRSFKPTADSFSLWGEAGDSALTDDDSVGHCSDVGLYYYVYSASFIFTPKRCKKLTGSMALTKGSGTNWVYIPTFVQETTRWEGYGLDCGAAAETNCTANSGVWGYTEATNQCSCVNNDEYFAKNAELNRVAFIHGYTVDTSGGFQKGVSTSQMQLRRQAGSSLKEDEAGIETTFLSKSTGKPCNLGGRRVWTTEDVKQGLSVTAEEILECVGLDLDKQYDEFRSYDELENKAPYLRQTGVVITAYMMFENVALRPGFDNDPSVQCKVLLDASLAWNSQTGQETLAVPGPTGNYSARKDFYSYGISVNFVVGGSFGYLDFGFLLAALVDVFVLIGIPTKLIQLMIFYCLGPRSAIYREAVVEVFDLPAYACGLVGRKLAYASAFQTISRQLDVQLGDMNKMKKNHFSVVLAKFFERYCQGEILDAAEISVLSSFIFVALDEDGSGELDMKEFINTAGGNEPMDLQQLTTLFDVHRKPGLMERIFDDGISRYVRETSKKAQAHQAALDAVLEDAFRKKELDDVYESQRVVHRHELDAHSAELEALEKKLQSRIDALEAKLEDRVQEERTRYAQEPSPTKAELSMPSPLMFTQGPAPPDMSFLARDRTSYLPETSLQKLEKSLQDLETAFQRHVADSQQLISSAVAEHLGQFRKTAEERSAALKQAFSDMLQSSLLQHAEAAGTVVHGDKSKSGRLAHDHITGLLFDVAELKGHLRSLDTEVDALSRKLRSSQEVQMRPQPRSPPVPMFHSAAFMPSLR
eukprot:TRINITY_DN8040_c0_g1_i1.p1 TRINITY_DN8040_c0_g1~~TRINITY_DN8040_c0_g1_i1.p1  ORF type:complete len:807 (-),score=123.59 TRINITY_DN8040_c0_g1_i1:11-2431(-)